MTYSTVNVKSQQNLIQFRRKVLKIKEKEGLSFSEVAEKFGISKAAVFRWSQNIEPQKNRNKKWIKIDDAKLKKDIEDYPDSYCYERAKRLGVSETGISILKNINVEFWTQR